MLPLLPPPSPPPLPLPRFNRNIQIKKKDTLSYKFCHAVKQLPPSLLLLQWRLFKVSAHMQHEMSGRVVHCKPARTGCHDFNIKNFTFHFFEKQKISHPRRDIHHHHRQDTKHGTGRLHQQSTMSALALMLACWVGAFAAVWPYLVFAACLLSTACRVRICG